ncbi:uncharacterized protein V6R79_012939 [Siganus canaliculatus]
MASDPGGVLSLCLTSTETMLIKTSASAAVTERAPRNIRSDAPRGLPVPRCPNGFISELQLQRADDGVETPKKRASHEEAPLCLKNRNPILISIIRNQDIDGCAAAPAERLLFLTLINNLTSEQEFSVRQKAATVRRLDAGCVLRLWDVV